MKIHDDWCIGGDAMGERRYHLRPEPGLQVHVHVGLDIDGQPVGSARLLVEYEKRIDISLLRPPKHASAFFELPRETADLLLMGGLLALPVVSEQIRQVKNKLDFGDVT